MADRMGGLDPTEIVQAASAMKDQVSEFVAQASERLELDRRIRENPWAVLGVAAGAGFLLGGGLWPALRPMVKAATRAALSPSNLLAVAAAFGAMKAASGGDEESENGADVSTPTSH